MCVNKWGLVNSFPPVEMSLILRRAFVHAGEAGLSTDLPALPALLGSRSRVNGASGSSGSAYQICFSLFQIKNGVGIYFLGFVMTISLIAPYLE